MFKHFDSAVVATKPDLVLWQLGTNSIIHDSTLSGYDASIRDGLKKIRAIGADVVLIDPQYAPKVIAKAGAASMVHLIAATAKYEDVDLFRRFDMMKHWREADRMEFQTFLSADGLHMNDWGYACMAKGLAIAIAEAAQQPVESATTKARDLAAHSQAELNKVARQLNERPRKTLDFQSPAERFSQCVAATG